MKKLFLSFLLAVTVSLFILPLSPKVSANHKSGKLDYLIGTGVVCGLDPSACPAISMANNGDIVEMTGEGSIDLGTRSVTGGGTFIHKDEDGNVLGSGDWHALELVSFKSWEHRQISLQTLKEDEQS